MHKPSESSETKLERYFGLAEKIRSLVNEFIREGSRKQKSEPQELNLRDRVLIGLAIKAYNSFECLIQDAKNFRSEAFHHLKTLAETYIYFQWVGVEVNDSRAKLILAVECRSKIGFFDANPCIGLDKNVRDNVERTLSGYIQGLEIEWKHFKNLSLKQIAENTDANMVDWYNRTYKIACEPAHISDLSEYVPPARGPINLTASRETSEFRVYVALDFALQIMCEVLKNLSDIYELGLTEAVVELKTKLDATRPLPMVQ
jgi:Family of unknown function (DUF5677)